MLIRLLILGLLYVPCLSQAQTDLPAKLVFAVQPHDAKKYRDNPSNDSIVYKLAHSLNVEIELYECPWARCMQAINTGEADVIDDLFKGTEREEFIHFVEPSFELQTAGFRFYADNTRTPLIATWDDLTGLTIGSLRGYKHFPKFDEASYLNKLDFISIETIQNLLMKGRIDVFIAPPSFDSRNFKVKGAKDTLVKQPFSHVEKLPLYVGISKQSRWHKHSDLLNQKMRELLQSN